MSEPAAHRRLVAVRLDEGSIGRGSPDQAHERAVAIYDLVEENQFCPEGCEDGPFELDIVLQEGKLVLDIKMAGGAPVVAHILSLMPFRRAIRDYFLICESYYDAIRTASPSRIETIDMARRALHDEGAHLLMARLKGKIAMDFATARRLFTLLSVLHWKG